MESYRKAEAVAVGNRVYPEFEAPRRWGRPFGDAGKRLFDLAAAGIGLIVLSPVMLLVALVLKLSDPRGAVLFRQHRIGKDFRPFRICKFRSMVCDAEKVLLQSPELHAKYIRNNYKLDPSEDPRITPFGRFLRKTSLDELPQLLNVLAGHMSLVGPRPVVREELAHYGKQAQLLLSVRPGVTGYWQVSGRSSVGYPERKELELQYIRRRSFAFDLLILLKTVVVVFLKRGAY